MVLQHVGLVLLEDNGNPTTAHPTLIENHWKCSVSETQSYSPHGRLVEIWGWLGGVAGDGLSNAKYLTGKCEGGGGVPFQETSHRMERVVCVWIFSGATAHLVSRC